MAFWIRKNAPTKVETGKEQESSISRKRKDEKLRPQVKRIDNLRIPHQLGIVMKSLGTRNEFSFLTRDLSNNGVFVVCQALSDYPFQQTSTLLDCEVDLGAQSNPPYTKIRFLGKIARIVERSSATTDIQSIGFGVRMVQISPESRVVLENFIAAHGKPDLSNAAIADMKFGTQKKLEVNEVGVDSNLPSAS